MDITKSEKLYTINEVAELLKVDHQTIRRYIKTGKIKVYQSEPKGNIRIPVEEINYLFKEKI